MSKVTTQEVSGVRLAGVFIKKKGKKQKTNNVMRHAEAHPPEFGYPGNHRVIRLTPFYGGVHLPPISNFTTSRFHSNKTWHRGMGRFKVKMKWLLISTCVETAGLKALLRRTCCSVEAWPLATSLTLTLAHELLKCNPCVGSTRRKLLQKQSRACNAV